MQAQDSDEEDGGLDGCSRRTSCCSGSCVRENEFEERHEIGIPETATASSHEQQQQQREEEKEERERCTNNCCDVEQDLRLLLQPLVANRNRRGRNRRDDPQQPINKKMMQEEDDVDEGIAECTPAESTCDQVAAVALQVGIDGLRVQVCTAVAVDTKVRKRKTGILVIRTPDEEKRLQGLERKISERRVSWGATETIEISREEEGEDQESSEGPAISFFLLHSSQVWFASMGFVFVLASSLPFLAPLVSASSLSFP